MTHHAQGQQVPLPASVKGMLFTIFLLCISVTANSQSLSFRDCSDNATLTYNTSTKRYEGSSFQFPYRAFYSGGKWVIQYELAFGTYEDLYYNTTTATTPPSCADGATNGWVNADRYNLCGIKDSPANSLTLGVNGTLPVASISAATYDVSSGLLNVAGRDFPPGAVVDVSKLTVTAEGGTTYTLTSSNVATTNSTAFAVTLNATDRQALHQVLNKNGIQSTGLTPYNLGAAAGFLPDAGADQNGNPIMVSNVAVPMITSASYDANSGILVVSGTGFLKLAGDANDIQANKFTFRGQGGATYTLANTANVDITSGSSFTLLLNTTDRNALLALMNKNGTSAKDGSTYNLGAAEDWNTGADVNVVIADHTGNGITVSNVDQTAPTVTISSTAGANGSTTSTSPIPFTLTFSENVSAPAAADISVTNGSITTAPTGSGTTYTFSVTPTSLGTITVNLPANVVSDLSGNGNTAAAQFSITYEQPSANVTSMTRLNPSPTAMARVSYQVVFSTAITGLDASNFDINAGGMTGVSIASISGSGTTYTVVINTGSGDGNIYLDLDNANNLSHAVQPYTAGAPYAVTKNFAAAPVFRLQAIGSASGNPDVTAFVDAVQVLANGSSTVIQNAVQNGSFETNNVQQANHLYQSQGVVANPWTFGLQAGISRNGSGFGSVAADGNAIALLQSATGNNGSIQQSLALPTGSYQLSYRAIQRNYTSLDQRLRAFINDVHIGDFQPNNIPTYGTFTSVAFNVTAPALTATVSTTSASPTTTSPIPFSVSFSQSVGTSFTASDVTVNGGSINTSSFSGSGSGPYTFTVSPSGTGTVSVSLAAGVATDANHTGNTASNTLSLQYVQPATAAPVITAPANAAYVNSTTPTYSGTAAASSTVTVYVDGSAIGTTTATAGGTFSINQPTALSQGSHTVYATAQRSGASLSPNSSTNTFTVDNVNPTVAISSTAASPTSTSPIPITVTFSESVSGFDVAGLTVTNATIDNFSGSGTTYTFNLSPLATGPITIDIATGAAKDMAGNNNSAASQFRISYFNTLPVNLESFTAKIEGNHAKLEWATLSEQHNRGFQLFRSQDGQTFSFLTTIDGRGTTSAKNNYTYIDRSPNQGVNYYKLVQLDQDGTPTDLGIKTLRFELRAKDQLTLAPNPARDRTRLSFPLGTRQLTILDVSGKILHEVKVSALDTEQALSTSHLPKGSYVLRCKGNYGVLSIKLIKID